MLFVCLLVSVVAERSVHWPDRPIRWGILGTGHIAADMARVLMQLEDTHIAAVGQWPPILQSAVQTYLHMPAIGKPTRHESDMLVSKFACEHVRLRLSVLLGAR